MVGKVLDKTEYAFIYWCGEVCATLKNGIINRSCEISRLNQDLSKPLKKTCQNINDNSPNIMFLIRLIKYPFNLK